MATHSILLATGGCTSRSWRRVLTSSLSLSLILACLYVGRGYIRQRASINTLQNSGAVVSSFVTLPWPPNNSLRVHNLMPFSRLQVAIWNCRLSEKELQAFANALDSLNRMDTLALAGPDVDDRWLRAMEHVQGIEVLALEGTTVSNAGLENLKLWDSLQILKLQRNSAITDPSCTELVRTLPGLQVLSDK
ncbi:MAG: hypothetical protein KDA79_11570 [Planctomycetaceae bacterium]|nr:hypothetical protein [Planctomycetaceae bacterium]